LKPERTAVLVERWIRYYTRELPDPVAERRVDEVGADLHDHIQYERARSTSDVRIALSILSRMVRGLTADVTWRRQVRTNEGDAMKRSAPILIAVLGLIIGIPAMLIGSADDAPGLVLLGLMFIAGTMVFALRPALRNRKWILGAIFGGAAVWVAVTLVAGWLENINQR
jgi:hypothetical protein